jgi:hypothetical protein
MQLHYGLISISVAADCCLFHKIHDNPGIRFGICYERLEFYVSHCKPYIFEPWNKAYNRYVFKSALLCGMSISWQLNESDYTTNESENVYPDSLI